MNQKILSMLSVAILAVSVSATASVPSGNQILVKFKTDAKRDRKAMNSVYSSFGVDQVQRYRGLMDGLELWTSTSGQDLKQQIETLKARSDVEFAQPNYILYKTPEPKVDSNARVTLGDGGCWIPGIPLPPGCEGDALPPFPAQRPGLQPPPAEVTGRGDPRLTDQYALGVIHAQEAWTQWKGSKSMIVAVIDTGADYNNPDLAANMWRNPTPTNGDVVGYDFVHNDGLPYDDNEHGTHCSGVIGAVGDNGIGTSGVNQKVSIMALKFLSGEGQGTTADAIRAIDYGVAHGAKVMSNSWGGPADEGNPALEQSIQRAMAADVLFVAASGNESTNNDTSDKRSYPASFKDDNVISVAATNYKDKFAFFSNFGPQTTHLAAPGVNVLSTTPQGTYRRLSGTSMAAPHVAGAAALVWSRHPEWTYKQVKDALLKTVDPVSALQGKVSTGGRLNVAKALSYQP